MSRLLFSSLLSAILSEMEQVLTEGEVDETRVAIREGIQQTLVSSLLYHPPFIGSIQVEKNPLMNSNNFLLIIRMFAIMRNIYNWNRLLYLLQH